MFMVFTFRVDASWAAQALMTRCVALCDAAAGCVMNLKTQERACPWAAQ
jgi:hypothetical protein